jgi:hypothetical protein
MPPIPAPVPFVVPDLRAPGEAMASLPLKLPADALAQLQVQADRLRCNRGALARTLIVLGLKALEEAIAAKALEEATAAQGVQ